VTLRKQAKWAASTASEWSGAQPSELGRPWAGCVPQKRQVVGAPDCVCRSPLPGPQFSNNMDLWITTLSRGNPADLLSCAMPWGVHAQS
jgi:hypothetical protein